jgi:hypothetical protein
MIIVGVSCSCCYCVALCDITYTQNTRMVGDEKDAKRVEKAQ